MAYTDRAAGHAANVVGASHRAAGLKAGLGVGVIVAVAIAVADETGVATLSTPATSVPPGHRAARHL